MRAREGAVALAAVAAVCIACGGGGSATPATGASPSARATPSPGQGGGVTGEVVTVNGDTVTVTSPEGTDESFVVGPSTTYGKQVPADISEATVGSCALAIGQRTAVDLVSARTVLLGSRRPDGSCKQAAGGSVGRVGAAGGRVTAVDGTTYTVDALGSPQRFTVTLRTAAGRLLDAGRDSLAVGVCVSAIGPHDTAGRVTARRVTIFTASAGGCGSGRSGAAGGG